MVCRLLFSLLVRSKPLIHEPAEILIVNFIGLWTDADLAPESNGRSSTAGI
jgi:hypothetical protein